VKGLNLPTTLVPFESVADAASLAKETKLALAGPLPWKKEHAFRFAAEFGLHSRVFRSFAPASIPKPGVDLYSDTDFNAVMVANQRVLQDPNNYGNLPLPIGLESSAQVANVELMTDLASDTVREALKVALQSSRQQINLLFKEADLQQTQLCIAQALEDVVKAYNASVEDGKVDTGVVDLGSFRPGELANAAVMFPQVVGTVVIPPFEVGQVMLNLLEGLVGGSSFSSFVWKGNECDVYHTGDYVDGENANPVGAFLALCALLVNCQQGELANKVYNALRKVAVEHNTFELCAQNGANALANAVLEKLK